MRIRDYGMVIGNGKTGKLNKITDVPGVKVGHYTLKNETYNTGITAILSTDGNIFTNKVIRATHTINGFGKSMGLMMIDEVGYIETPIILTSTLSVGKAADGLISYTIKK